MTTSLYRAVSMSELSDIRESGVLRSGPGSCEGKHLAFSYDDARRWGIRWFGIEPFAIIRIVAPQPVVDKFYHWERLDNIGPACFATNDELVGITVEVVNES